MKILLISPASGNWKKIGKRKFFNGKPFRFSMLSLLSVAKFSPDDAEITMIDEQLDDIPSDIKFDLVGVTVMTATLPRANEIARHFKAKGVPVVFGGFYPTLNPQQASIHPDAIVIGSASGAWQKIIEDVKNGKLKNIYHGAPEPVVPKTLPRHLVSSKNYITANSTFATVGCKNKCHFCSISAFHKARHFTRPIEDVVAEISSFKEKFFMFVDDNLTQNREYAIELFKALTPLKKQWGTQASVELADDRELLIAMKESGCIGVFVGLETFNDTTLAMQDKAIKPAQHYHDAIARFHSFGMMVESGIIVGFDNDDVTVFSSTLNMLNKIGIDAIQLAIMTPLPGTVLHDQMKHRIIDDDLENYDYRHVVFQPKQMTTEQLQAGSDWMIRKFYSRTAIAKRMLRRITQPCGLVNIIYPFVINIGYYGRVKSFKIRGYDPAKEKSSISLAKYFSAFRKRPQKLLTQN
ncbi:MAG: radical SAM protein [Anaerohalosphaera sp.]|nr:radical SAM protein [Anaerohalosphaera sp.]